MSRKIRQDKRKLTTIKFSPPLLPSLLNCVDGNTNSKRKHELLLLPFPFPPASSPVLPFPRSQPMLPPSISVSTCTQTTSHLYPAPSAAPAHLCARSLSLASSGQRSLLRPRFRFRHFISSHICNVSTRFPKKNVLFPFMIASSTSCQEEEEESARARAPSRPSPRYSTPPRERPLVLTLKSQGPSPASFNHPSMNTILLGKGRSLIYEGESSIHKNLSKGCGEKREKRRKSCSYVREEEEEEEKELVGLSLFSSLPS